MTSTVQNINTDTMNKFTEMVTYQLNNHNNFMILHKYKIDDAIYLHEKIQICNLESSPIFIPQSRMELKSTFILNKGLEFIKKYNISEYINTNKKITFDKDQFIKWYNIRDKLHVHIVPRIRSERYVIEAIDHLLNIHGLQLKSENEYFFITTLIDYDSFKDLGIKFETLKCPNSALLDRIIEHRNKEVAAGRASPNCRARGSGLAARTSPLLNNNELNKLLISIDSNYSDGEPEYGARGFAPRLRAA